MSRQPVWYTWELLVIVFLIAGSCSIAFFNVGNYEGLDEGKIIGAKIVNSSSSYRMDETRGKCINVFGVKECSRCHQMSVKG